MSSSWELTANKILRKSGVYYRREFQILPDRQFRTDFICKYPFWRYFVIEIDWEKYHSWIIKKLYDIKRDFLIKQLAKTKIYRVSYKNLKNKIRAILFIEQIKVFVRIAFMIYMWFFLYNNLDLILFIIRDNLHYLKNFNYWF